KQSQEIAEGLVEREIGKLARQVAHDIRSPISALRVVEKILISNPSGSLKLLSQSIRRVSDISADLLEKSKKAIEHTPDESGTDPSPFTVRGEEALFLRSISNVIQNAIDAVTSGGHIQVTLKNMNGFIEVIIKR